MSIIKEFLKHYKMFTTILTKFLKKNPKARVLIHCAHGSSRSGSIAISYIMKVEKKTFSQALDAVKAHRAKIKPIDAFQEQLTFWQEIGFKYYNEIDTDTKKKKLSYYRKSSSVKFVPKEQH
mmetsp:Transcript_22210/g.33050  ORF Transcript_22210/g.33050 Transcript_22210/m.33050 type:complete len:122 (+) Transcript_22210:222-587(+)